MGRSHRKRHATIPPPPARAAARFAPGSPCSTRAPLLDLRRRGRQISFWQRVDPTRLPMARLRATMVSSGNRTMTYFRDLTDYYYLHSFSRPATRNVGWLAPEHERPTEVPTDEILEALWAHCGVSVAQTRGVHACELCDDEESYAGSRNGARLLLGTSEIRVFARSGEIFAAPRISEEARSDS